MQQGRREVVKAPSDRGPLGDEGDRGAREDSRPEALFLRGRLLDGEDEVVGGLQHSLRDRDFELADSGIEAQAAQNPVVQPDGKIGSPVQAAGGLH